MLMRSKETQQIYSITAKRKTLLYISIFSTIDDADNAIIETTEFMIHTKYFPEFLDNGFSASSCCKNISHTRIVLLF